MTNALLLACLLAAAPAAAAPSEAGRASAAASFSAVMPFKAAFVPRLTAKDGVKADVKTTGTKQIRLSGHVWLQGSGYAGQGQRAVTVTVSGYTQLRDQDGKLLNGDIRISDTNTYWLNSSHVSGWARPYAYVNIYSNAGKYLGSVSISGSIYVSGWHNGGWLDLRGSGTVDGSGTINEE
jgi:hypothetical protein